MFYTWPIFYEWSKKPDNKIREFWLKYRLGTLLGYQTKEVDEAIRVNRDFQYVFKIAEDEKKRKAGKMEEVDRLRQIAEKPVNDDGFRFD